MKIATLLLAAGASSRMGKPKQLLPWRNGTLIEHAADLVLSSDADRCIAVLGANAEAVRSALGDRHLEIVLNDRWEDGMGSSISTGMTYLLRGSQPVDAVLIMLADQPFVDTNFLNQLIDHCKAGDGEIICTHYGRKKGPPAIFLRKYFTALSELEGEKGAGGLIATHPNSVFSLEGGRRTTDLDTPEDYHKLRQNPLNS